MRYLARVGGKEMTIEIVPAADGSFGIQGSDARARLVGGAVILSQKERTTEAVVTRAGPSAAGGVSPGGTSAGAATGASGARLYSVTLGGRTFAVALEDPSRAERPAAGALSGGRAEISSVMPGKVVALLVQEGEQVTSGQGLVVIEAMKMENEIPSPRDGRVSGIRVRPGEAVEAGAVLLVVE